MPELSQDYQKKLEALEGDYKEIGNTLAKIAIDYVGVIPIPTKLLETIWKISASSTGIENVTIFPSTGTHHFLGNYVICINYKFSKDNNGYLGTGKNYYIPEVVTVKRYYRDCSI